MDQMSPLTDTGLASRLMRSQVMISCELKLIHILMLSNECCTRSVHSMENLQQQVSHDHQRVRDMQQILPQSDRESD